MGKYLFPAFVLAFFLITFGLFINAQPQERDKRVYNLLKPYIPYKLEKKMSGLFIRNTKTDEKIEPKNSDLFHVLDNLEKDWGDKYLFRDNDKLIIVDDENKTIKTIILQNDNERKYIKEFFNK